jgi:hypothetical protein
MFKFFTSEKVISVTANMDNIFTGLYNHTFYANNVKCTQDKKGKNALATYAT